MRETGYFLPHVAIGYAATVAAALGVWPILRFVVGVRSDQIILASMIAVGLGFGAWFIRYAKMIWIVIDLWLHPATREDFQPRGRN